MDFFPFLIGDHRTPEQKDEEERRKIAEDLKEFLDRMSPDERKKFWAQHEKDTSQD